MQDSAKPPSTEPLEYLDFELEIGLGSGPGYPVKVLHSPAGEAQEMLHFPFDDQEREERLHALEKVLLSSYQKHLRKPPPDQQAVQDFGQVLFEALMAREVRSRYDASRNAAVGQGKGLRLKLRIQPPELALLPWEFLYDSRQGEYVCLSRNTPVVRYLAIPQPGQPLSVPQPLRVLGMVACPKDLPKLDAKQEKRRVEKAIKNLQTDGLVEMVWLPGQTWRDLLQAMQKGPWHVFHFIGHGWFDRSEEEGFIALVGEAQKTYPLSATELGRLLADHRSLRLVLLNACEGARGGERDIFSSTAAILMRRGIPAVLAMQYPITDKAAIEFASNFYGALANSMPVDAAISEARKAVSLGVKSTVEWGIPVLHMRSPDGALFRIQSKKDSAPSPEEQIERQYTKGKEMEATDPQSAYQLLYAIYERYPNYDHGHVAELCADIALKISSQSTPTNLKQRVEWLERAVKIMPNHREGNTQESLDDYRHRWAEELSDRDRSIAIAQLERISHNYVQWPKVYQQLAEAYYQLLRKRAYTRTEQSNAGAEAEARYRLGIQQWGKEDLPGAVEQLAEIPSGTQEFQSAQIALAEIYQVLGERALLEGNLQSALEWCEKALAIKRPPGRESGTINVRFTLLRIYVALGEKERQEEHLQAARTWYERALDSWSALKEEVGVQKAQSGLLEVYDALGKEEYRGKRWRKARELYEKADLLDREAHR